MNSDETKVDKLVGLLMSYELEQMEDLPPPVKGNAFAANADDESGELSLKKKET